MPIWQLFANVLIPNCLRSNLSYSPLAALELYVKKTNPENYYINVIMQEKIRLYLEYVGKVGFWYDIKLIFKTFKVIVTER